MKDKIHPKINNVIFLDVMSSAEFVATSTLKSEEVKTIDGVDYFVIRVETSSASHPFYTGKKSKDVRSDRVADYLRKVANAQEKNKPKPATEKSSEDGESKAKKPAKSKKK